MFNRMLSGSSGGGGIDISDLIAQTSGFNIRTVLNVYYALFVVGINSISIASVSTSHGQMRDADSDSGNILVNDITNTPIVVDVSSYNVVYVKGTGNQQQDYTIQVLS